MAPRTGKAKAPKVKGEKKKREEKSEHNLHRAVVLACLQKHVNFLCCQHALLSFTAEWIRLG